MKKYKSHKIVEAAKISLITTNGLDEPLLELEGNNTAVVDVEWLDKHRPSPGGYYVKYEDEDGYTSYSPVKAFEEGYIAVAEESKAERIKGEPGSLQPEELIELLDRLAKGDLFKGAHIEDHPAYIAARKLEKNDTTAAEYRFGTGNIKMTPISRAGEHGIRISRVAESREIGSVEHGGCTKPTFGEKGETFLMFSNPESARALQAEVNVLVKKLEEAN